MSILCLITLCTFGLICLAEEALELTDIAEATTTVTITKGSTGDRSYTANWEVIEYTITIDLEEGELEQGKSNPETYDVEDNITLNNPTKEGFRFIGWTGTNGNEPAMNVTISKGSSGDKYYKASEQFPTYYKDGGLIPGSTIATNFNKTRSKTSYNFYETMDLTKPTLNRNKIWENKLKKENLDFDRNYVEKNIVNWEKNILNDFDPNYSKKKIEPEVENFKKIPQREKKGQKKGKK